jgi:hypothetical protein
VFGLLREVSVDLTFPLRIGVACACACVCILRSLWYFPCIEAVLFLLELRGGGPHVNPEKWALGFFFLE